MQEQTRARRPLKMPERRGPEYVSAAEWHAKHDKSGLIRGLLIALGVIVVVGGPAAYFTVPPLLLAQKLKDIEKAIESAERVRISAQFVSPIAPDGSTPSPYTYRTEYYIGNRQRVELLQGRLVIASDGDTYRVHEPAFRTIRTYEAATTSPTLRRRLLDALSESTGWNKRENVEGLRSLEFMGMWHDVVRITRAGQRTTLWVNSKTHFPSRFRLEYQDEIGEWRAFTEGDMHTAFDLPQTRFLEEPPEGSEIVDPKPIPRNPIENNPNVIASVASSRGTLQIHRVDMNLWGNVIVLMKLPEGFSDSVVLAQGGRVLARAPWTRIHGAPTAGDAKTVSYVYAPLRGRRRLVGGDFTLRFAFLPAPGRPEETKEVSFTLQEPTCLMVPDYMLMSTASDLPYIAEAQAQTATRADFLKTGLRKEDGSWVLPGEQDTLGTHQEEDLRNAEREYRLLLNLVYAHGIDPVHQVETIYYNVYEIRTELGDRRGAHAALLKARILSRDRSEGTSRAADQILDAMRREGLADPEAGVRIR